ncbi:MFS transporter [Chitiniphilus purpureus]|uniref:MFS transporter n=1 Tax=Chitiniphilus purpureus TaxID=2981137 RepID=A0ABY6DLY6_9NEIS|nr:MFS transporter [Chitiniphilus sp. CD1]UXY15385.1 MFS transporter [Chitiniphilus sp. CD1]
MSTQASPFVRLAASNLAAQSAQQIGLAAAPLVAVLALGSDVTGTGLLQVAQTLPFLLLAIPLGVLADRTARRWLMAAGELLRAVAFVAVVVLAATDALNLGLLALLAFVGTAGAVAYSVATPALIPALVPHGQLARANGQIELVRSLALTGGPALAGLLVGLTGAGVAFALAAGLSVLAALALAGLPEGHGAAAPRRDFYTELREGTRFALTQPLLRPLLATSVLFNIAYVALQTAYIPYAVRHLGLSGGSIGVTLAAYGAGMVLSAVAAPLVTRHWRAGLQLAAGPYAALFAIAAMLATLYWPAAWLAAACFFLLGAGAVLWTVAATTLRQAVTPAPLLGRVSSINTLATYGARPLGAAFAAAIGMLGGDVACLVLAAICFAGQAVWVAVSPLPRLTRLPEPAAM